MNVKCCYRLTYYGEVIHDEMDSDTHEIPSMPKHFFDTTQLDLPVYNAVSYFGADVLFDQACEAILLSNKDFAIVIECNNLGYYAYQWDGTRVFLESPMDMDPRFADSLIPTTAGFKSIGYRVTKPIQVRSLDGIFRLTVSADGKYAYTNDGVLDVEFDVNTLSPISYKYEGYKDAVQSGAYGVVYVDEKPVLVYRDGNKLFLSKEG